MAVRQLRRADTAGLPDDFALPGSRYGFGVSWDAVAGKPKIDIDLQCVVVNDQGVIIDCAYYNNMKAARAITHSGDEATGAADGIDELVWVTLPKLPQNVPLLIFVVAAYSGGKLKDVANGTLHVLDQKKTNEIARFEMERSYGSVDVVAAMFRGQNGWTMRIIDEPAQQGQHFMDILPLLCDVIRVFQPNAPRRQKVAFAMEKGGVLDLPQSLNAITVGLGWDTDEGEADLDVSAILLDATGNEIETVFFGRLKSLEHGIEHSGDNLTGAGEGDDEQIMAKLDVIGPAVQQVFFIINVYTRGKNFQQVANPYCRVVDDASGNELCRYSLRDAGRENGLIVSKIAREAGGRWGFHALGIPTRGTMYKDCLPHVRKICHDDTRKLMARGGTVELAGADGTSGGRGPATARAPEKSKDCCVQ